MNLIPLINITINKTPTLLYLFFLNLFFLLACSDPKEDNPGTDTDLQSSIVSISTRMGIEDNNYALMEPLELYLFNADGDYLRKADITKNQNKITTELNQGSYHMGLLTCLDGRFTFGKGVHLPAEGASLHTTKMWDWETWENEENSAFLKPMPELVYEIFPQVLSGEQVNIQANLVRNVACIEVEFKQTGFYTDRLQKDEFKKLCYLELRGMPSKLAWDGKLLPDKDNPELTTLPLREYLEFDNSGIAKKVRFVVPAHRGTDHNLANPADIVDFSPVKLRLQACLPDPYENTPVAYFADRYGDGIEISISPKMNRILSVTINMPEPGQEGKLSIQMTVKDWEDIFHNPEF